MNYKESAKILKEIKKAKRILLNCHRGPDPDSIGSALAMYAVLKKIDKEVEIICPSGEVPDSVSFLESYNKIKKRVDFLKFNFSEFDLFITLDTSNWGMVTDKEDFTAPTIPTIVIDHHGTNTRYGKINIVDDNVTSTSELLYQIFEDWEVGIDKNIATALMTGIVGDTGAFRYPGSTIKTFEIASNLMKKGADKDEVIFNLYQSVDFSLLKFWGEVLKHAKFDEKYSFVWSALPEKTFTGLGDPLLGRESSAGLFAQIVKGTNFGIVMIEQGKDILKVSIRSRTGFDTSQIALELGGGGRVYTSGATVKGLPFKDAVDKVLEVARKYAKAYDSKNRKKI